MQEINPIEKKTNFFLGVKANYRFMHNISETKDKMMKDGAKQNTHKKNINGISNYKAFY